MKYGAWHMHFAAWNMEYEKHFDVLLLQTVLCPLRAVVRNKLFKPLKRKINENSETFWAGPHNSELNCTILIVRTHSEFSRLIPTVRSHSGFEGKWKELERRPNQVCRCERSDFMAVVRESRCLEGTWWAQMLGGHSGIGAKTSLFVICHPTRHFIFFFFSFAIFETRKLLLQALGWASSWWRANGHSWPWFYCFICSSEILLKR